MMVNPYDCSTCDSEDCSGCGEHAYELGYEKGFEDAKDISTQQAYETGLDTGRKEGRKEVGEWLEGTIKKHITTYDKSNLMDAIAAISQEVPTLQSGKMPEEEKDDRART